MSPVGGEAVPEHPDVDDAIVALGLRASWTEQIRWFEIDSWDWGQGHREVAKETGRL
jgi:hypothetical protein